ncbi:acyl-CoA synthetase (AMP-forming)/AMP-acid ligase II [Streptomyces sp. Ag109_G2-6]|uniref:AMP-binding protein n=1 Tax=Streptomyces TaxID=1883 RepID=UPI0009A48590|nr:MULTISPECIES: AMP-binding protein [Streptomyces]RPF44012.1 acyl-CoA synthetase (AMP-forming)/AMP-acid ligase II [Streptomyces sp. Ag109_G2-6]
MTQASSSAGPGRPAADTVLERFEQWARDTPGAPAVITPGGPLSYAGLDTAANRLAHHLLARRLPGGARIAIAPTRREETVLALLASLKAGAAYALVDPADTRTARDQLLALAPDLLLTDAAGAARLDLGKGLPALLADAEAEAIAAGPGHPPARAAQPAPAAILFTATAVPRPVPVGHALLLAAHEAWAQLARLTPEDRHLFTGGPDLTAFAAGWTRALCAGGALVLPQGPAWTPAEIPEAVSEYEVSALHTDPGGALRLLDRSLDPAGAARRGRREPAPRLSALRLLTVTGDRLYLDQQTALQDRLRPGARVLGVYGPTEAAGAGTWFELPQLPRLLDEPERLSLLGTPFPGSRVELRAGELLLTPPGGGEALATGDLAVLRPDGLLEFAGRLRDRITLADGSPLDPHPAESALRTHPGVGAAVLTPVGSRGNTRLVAYVAPPPDGSGRDGNGAPVDADGLREHLAGRVPSAAIPVRVVRLPTLPRTRAGQEDRAAVPQPPQPGARPVGGGKYGASAGGELPGCFGFGCAAVPLTVVALFATDLIWPGSTDLTGVPGPWSFLFSVLYLFECSAFAAGLLFLFAGRRRMSRPGPGRRLTAAAHLAVAYLLLAWWPQDNLYRLAAKHDWPRQAALVYSFNIPLMIAALIVAVYLTRRPAAPPSGSDG